MKSTKKLCEVIKTYFYDKPIEAQLLMTSTSHKPRISPHSVSYSPLPYA